MIYQTLKCTVDQGVLHLTLNRPDVMNAFTVQMADELIDVFTKANDQDEVRVIVVSGEGKAFCAGMDLSVAGNVFGLDESMQPTLEDMHNNLDEPDIVQGVRDTGGRVTLSIYNCTKPVIAAINGAAVGIGASMTCAMDIRLCSDRAKIGFVFNKIGITPEACSSWFLPRIVGISTALEWCYSGDILSAQQAYKAGFINKIYAPEALLEEAKKLALKIAQHSSVALAMTRQMMYRNSAFDNPLDAHRVDSLSMFYTSIGDGKEGVQAFLEKRAPQFKANVSDDMPPFYPWW